MNKKEKAILEETYQDCVNLNQKGDLTEFGEGQMMLCEMLFQK